MKKYRRNVGRDKEWKESLKLLKKSYWDLTVM